MDALFEHVLNRKQNEGIAVIAVKEFLIRQEYDSDALIQDLQGTIVSKSMAANTRISNLYQLWGDHIQSYRDYMRYHQRMFLILLLFTSKHSRDCDILYNMQLRVYHLHLVINQKNCLLLHISIV